MQRQNLLENPDNSVYSGLDNLEFDRPAPPAPPKRLQRMSRQPRSNAAQQQQQQAFQQQQMLHQQQQQMFQQQVLQQQQQQVFQQQALQQQQRFQQAPPAFPQHRTYGPGPDSFHRPQMPYPSAMVVGGGMPSHVLPAGSVRPAFTQRERDFANVVGRRRPTTDSVSSAGSDGVAGWPEQAEVPFNANDTRVSVDMQGRRYRGGTPTIQYSLDPADQRLGRSVSSTQGNGLTRPGHVPQQHRYLTAMPEPLRKRPSNSSMTSAIGAARYVTVPGEIVGRYDSSERYATHPGSRSVPDLDMRSMKEAISEAGKVGEHNPLPRIPAHYASGAGLSIDTDIPHTVGSERRDRSSSPGLETALDRQSSGTGSAPAARAHKPVNKELAAILETVKPVYPAILSAVARAFGGVLSQVLQTNTRNGLEYPLSFTGRDAVDAVCAIIQTSDRNLAVVVGRALAQQSLFHDVEYEHRLRDDPYEVFAFDNDITNARIEGAASGETAAGSGNYVNGVFVMLTDCYSPTCSASRPCYSVTCPRQLSQQAHLRATAKKNVSSEMKQGKKLWSMAVPQEIVKAVSRKELERQERMFEIFYGEKDYVSDLCVLRDVYMKPLHNSDVIDESRRRNFITKVFKNALAILAENTELQRRLEQRQKESFVCYQIGDIFVPFVEKLESYLEYCANQPYSLHFLEAEKKSNSRLVSFLDKADHKSVTRKLGINHFLIRPPTRLARYPLLLKSVLKRTPEGHPDCETIPYLITRIEAMLNRINVETGRAQNRLRLYKVDEKLVCSSSDRNDLRLTDDHRRLIRDSQLRKRGNADGSVIQVLLLDHMLLMCRVKKDPHSGEVKYSIYKRPVPLQLLTIYNPDDPQSMRPRMAARRDSTSGPSTPATAALSPTKTATSSATIPTPMAQGEAVDLQKEKYIYPLQITYLGRRGFTVTLYSNKLADRQQWYQCIEKQQLELMERHRKFEFVPVACTFPAGVKVNTADVYDHGRCIVIGTDRGLYLGLSGKQRSFQRLNHLRHDRVHQIEIHEKLNVIAMIADKDRHLYVYPLDLLMTATSSSRQGMRIKPLHSHVSFFRFGNYLDYDILCSVKSASLNNQTTIHVYKPMMSSQKNRSLGRFLSFGDTTADGWKCIKECYIAAESTSLHFLRSRLCVGCNRGFEIVDLATMNTQSLLDPADASLAFINKRDTTHPIALFKVREGEFLLCYDEFAFYVNRNGQRARSNWMIHWVGSPTSFKVQYPYILAFDPSFIEIYHVETAAIVQVIITGNCASLSPNRKNVNLCVTAPSPTQTQEVLRIQLATDQDPI